MDGWTFTEDGQTAVGAEVPVIADGDLFATVSPIWSDVDGVRVSIDWQHVPGGEISFGVSALGDMSPDAARALADVLRQVAGTPPPR